MSRRLRTLARLGVLALTCGLAAACVSIPDGSSVQPGRGSGVQQLPPLVHNVPDGPRTGASRQEIAKGYVAAMLAYPQSPVIVREFMAPQAAADWEPAARLVVYENPTVTPTPHSALLRAQVLGGLDERGSWTSASGPAATLSVQLDMVRIHRQWRITNPPQGTFVDSDYFRNDYKPFSLYFFDRQRPALLLAPDPVYLLIDDSTATKLVQDLLRGPTRELAGAVTTAAPSSTSVDVSVSVTTAGELRVPLSEGFLKLSSADRQLFAVQLTWTLKQLSQYFAFDVNRIVLTVDGNPLRIPDNGGSIPIDAYQYYDPAGLTASRQLYALSGGELVAVSQSGHLPVQGPIGTAQVSPRSAAVDPTAQYGALVSADGTQVVVGGMQPDQGPSVKPWFTGGHDLLPPSWDVRKTLWLVDRTTHGAQVYVTGWWGVRRVKVPGLTGTDVTSFAVSRAGVRLAAVVGRGAGARLVMAVIQRDPEHVMDVALTHVRTVSNADYPLTNLSGLAWVSPTSVIVLAQDEGSEVRPYEVSIDGSQVVPSTGFLPIRPVSLAAGPNSDTPTVIGARDGHLYVGTSTGQWTKFGGGDEYYQPFYPG